MLFVFIFVMLKVVGKKNLKSDKNRKIKKREKGRVYALVGLCRLCHAEGTEEPIYSEKCVVSNNKL